MDHNLCVLIDFDNIAKGSRMEGLGEFDIRLVMRRLKDIGRVLVARAYCDWDRWPRHRQALAEQGVTMIELVATGHGDKNRGDIALVVDAMELAFQREFLDTFVILSGDSDFTPLVQRLKELNRSVIGIGTRGSTSRLIANVCDEFFFYDSLVKRRAPEPDDEEEDDRARERPSRLRLDTAFALLVETLENYARDEAGPIHASIVKTSMKRKLPTFNENELGFRTFAKFMERAHAEGLVTLGRDDRGGGYRVELAPGPGEAPPPPVRRTPPPPPQATGPRNPDLAVIVRQADAAPEPPAGPVGAALELLRNEGLDLGLKEERTRLLDALAVACADRVTNGRRLAVQYLQGDLVQQGHDAERVRSLLQSLGRIGMLLHTDGEPVRSATGPMQPLPAAAELGALLEERALEILGSRRVKLDPASLALIFGGSESEPEAAREPEAAPAVAAAEPVDAEQAPSRGRRGARGGRRGGRRGEGDAEGTQALEGAPAEGAPLAAESSSEAAPAEAVEPDSASSEERTAGEGDDAAPKRRRRRTR